LKRKKKESKGEESDEEPDIVVPEEMLKNSSEEVVWQSKQETKSGLPKTTVKPVDEKYKASFKELREILRKTVDKTKLDVSSLEKFRKERDLPILDYVGTVFYFLFKKTLKGEIEKYGEILKKIVDIDPAAKPCILICFEEFLSERPSNIPQSPMLLKEFYDNDILEEEDILKWAKETSTSENSATAKKAVAPFVDWLEQAEEDGEEEAEE